MLTAVPPCPKRKIRRLVRLTKICLSLPEATCELKGDHAGFRVKKKTFAYFLNVAPKRLVTLINVPQTGQDG